jgi:large subunit ribosomal protein L17
MRHNLAGRRLSRSTNQRKALMKNLAISLIEHERIETTLPKAKELRVYVEPFITLSKTDSVANRRLAMSRLGSPDAVKKLFSADFRHGPHRTRGLHRPRDRGSRRVGCAGEQEAQQETPSSAPGDRGALSFLGRDRASLPP